MQSVGDIAIMAAPAVDGPGLGRSLAELLGAPDLRSFATRAAAYLEAQGLPGVLVGWTLDGDALHLHDASRLRQGDRALVQAARAAGWAFDAARGRLACRVETGEGRYAFSLIVDAGQERHAEVARQVELLAPVGAAIYEKSLLTASMEQLAHSEHLQSALFAIADMASSDMDLGDMLRKLHAIVASFMYAENFYIALYDDASDTLRFIYFVDTEDAGDATIRDADRPVPMSALEQGLTWYCIRDRQPLMGSLQDMRRQVSGPLRDIGTKCFDWLGVPVILGDRVRGVLVVQSYVERPRYTAADQALLSYVGSHILTAVDRKLAQEELERRVEERTQELQRSVRVQQTLYRIAELSHTATDLDEFYAAVHRIVGEFLDARNFYIATLSPHGDILHFPYFVDQYGTWPESRRYGRGITEYTIRRGRPWLVDMRDAEAAREFRARVESGEIEPHGPPDFQAWLGVPLVLGEKVMGLLAVQSYTPG
ncbi:GAF domain-containing protein, partial [Lysobacter sp. N42]|uniref:GAF domain-containing protein n=1 Tax=Lysobacter sp. N42 TaxID=2545719 RepID=UPI0010468128